MPPKAPSPPRRRDVDLLKLFFGLHASPSRLDGNEDVPDYSGCILSWLLILGLGGLVVYSAG